MVSPSPLFFPHFHLIFWCVLRNGITIGNNSRAVHGSYLVFQISFYSPADHFHMWLQNILHQLLTPFSLPLLLFTKVTSPPFFYLCFVTFQSPIISVTFVQMQKNLQHKISLPRNLICTLGTRVIKVSFAHRVVL